MTDLSDFLVEMEKCPDCDETCQVGEGDWEPLYTCSCGETFTRSGSATGSNHQCPSCNKFAAKEAEKACQSCCIEIETVNMLQCPECEETFDEDDEEGFNAHRKAEHGINADNEEEEEDDNGK